MDDLVEGYRRFRRTDWPQHRDRYEALAERGQSPRALVVACSDSRVDPQMIFGAAPGEFLVVRNVANLVPPYAPNADYHGTSAALEFAVRSLQVGQVVVMGHARCGGVQALLRDLGGEEGEFVTNWMRIAAPARDRALAIAGGQLEAAQRLCEHECVKVSLANLITFPWVRERVVAGNLVLHGCFFDIETGELHRLDPTGEYRLVPAEAA
jgi:carbonic anhydrase